MTAYKSSRSLKSFIGHTDNLIGEIDASRNLPSGAKELVLASAFLIGFGQLEEYLKGVLEDWFFQIDSHRGKPGFNCKKIPKSVRGYVLLSAHKELVSSTTNKTEREQIEKFLTQVVPVSILSDRSKIPTLKAEVIYQKIKYPSAENFEKMFNRIGISEIFLKLSRALRLNARDVLVSFNDIRCAIAHEAKLPNHLSVDDAIGYIEKLRKFTKEVDAILYAHIVFHSGVTTWQE